MMRVMVTWTELDTLRTYFGNDEMGGGSGKERNQDYRMWVWLSE